MSRGLRKLVALLALLLAAVPVAAAEALPAVEWVDWDALAPAEGEAEGDEAAGQPWYIATVNANLRAEATTGGAVVATVTKGTPLEGLGETRADGDTTWLAVAYGGKTCWVAAQNVRERTDEDVARAVEAQANARGTKVVIRGSVYLRSEPSMNAASLGVASGTVKYLNDCRLDERSSVWYYVEFNGNKGWVSWNNAELQ